MASWGIEFHCEVKAAKNITTRKVSVIDFKVEHLAPRYLTSTTVVINFANIAKIHKICPTLSIGGFIVNYIQYQSVIFFAILEFCIKFGRNEHCVPPCKKDLLSFPFCLESFFLLFCLKSIFFLSCLCSRKMNGLKDLLRHPNYPSWNSPASDKIIFREKKIGQIVRYLQVKIS